MDWPALIFFFIGMLFQACSDDKSGKGTAKEGPVSYEEGMKYYTGTESCKECHEAEYADWKNSQHDLAMMKATDESVKGNFDNATFDSQGVIPVFTKKAVNL